MGLWTTRDFYKHDFITAYSGHRVTGEKNIQRVIMEHKDAMTDKGQDIHSHTLSINRFEVILGFKTLPAPLNKGGGSYANDGGPSRNNSKYHKVHLNNGTEVVLLRAIRDIPKHNEVFVSYGSQYWTTRNMQCPK